jgi:hypothetical protein
MMTPGWAIPVDISKCHSEDFVDCISNYIILSSSISHEFSWSPYEFAGFLDTEKQEGK